MRKACAVIKLSRVVYLYKSNARDNSALVMRMEEITPTRVHYGYRRDFYNEERPHSALDWQTPKEFSLKNGSKPCLQNNKEPDELALNDSPIGIP